MIAVVIFNMVNSEPYCVRFGPDASSPEWVSLIISGLPFFLSLKAVLPHSLVYSHIVWQQMVTNVKLKSMPHAARI